MVFIKKFFWIPLVFFIFVLLSKKSENKRKSYAVTDFNLRPYNSSLSLDKKQMLLMKEIELIKNKMSKGNKNLQFNNTPFNRNHKDNEMSDFSEFPNNHIVLPDGNVISPIPNSLLVNEAISKDGRKFYYSSTDDLIEKDKFGNITNHGKQKVKILKDHIYVGGKKVAKLESYTTKYAVDSAGNAFMNKKGEMINKSKNGKNIIIGTDGKIVVTGSNVLLSADGISLNKTNIGSLETEKGNKIYVNERGEIIEEGKDGTKLNHGIGKLKINKDGNIIMQSKNGEEKLLGKAKITNRGIITDKGSKIYKNYKGEVVEITNDGIVINHGVGKIIKNKDGSVIIKTEDGKVRKMGNFKEEFSLITKDSQDIIFTKDGIEVISGKNVTKGESLEIINEDVNFPHMLKKGEIINSDDGYTYKINTNGDLIEISPEGTIKNLGKKEAYFDGKNLIVTQNGKTVLKKNVKNIRKNSIILKSKGLSKFLTISRRLTPGEIVYTISGNTYFVVDNGLIIKVDKYKNFKKFIGALFIKKGWLYIFKNDGIATERILKQSLKDEVVLNTSTNKRFIKKDGKVYEEKNNKVSNISSFKIDGNNVYANGRYVGDIESIQKTKIIGTGKGYKVAVNKSQFISASLLGKDKINVSVGEKNIIATVNKKINTTKSSIKSKFNLLKKKLSIKNKKDEKVKVTQTIVAPVSDGEIIFFEEDLKTIGVEGEDYYTIPMLTLIVADMRFGAIAPTEDSSKEKVSFDLKKNVVLKNGQIIPLKGGGVRGTVQGEYNSERGIFETDKVIFYGPEADSYYEGELKTRVISAEDYINGLEGDIISKQDKVMLEILQGELIGGFSDFVATANNPLSAISGQQNFQMSDVLAGSALSGIGKSGKKYVDFKIENAKKLLPVIALHPGRLVILEVWETTKVWKI